MPLEGPRGESELDDRVVHAPELRLDLFVRHAEDALGVSHVARAPDCVDEHHGAAVQALRLVMAGLVDGRQQYDAVSSTMPRPTVHDRPGCRERNHSSIGYAVCES